jgi:hypothetical protein
MVLCYVDPVFSHLVWWYVWLAHALVVWAIFSQFRSWCWLRRWGAVNGNRRDSEGQDKESSRIMAWLLNLASRARKVPLAGWLLAALVFLFILVVHFARRAHILGQRVMIEKRISAARRNHERVMRGHNAKFDDIRDSIEEMRTGTIAKLEEREYEIKKRSFNMDTTASLVNEVFGK